jgi:hypothetical protein
VNEIPNAPLTIRSARFELVDDAVDDVVLDLHAVRGHVARRGAVPVRLAHLERIAPEVPRDVVHDALDEHHALRAAEAAERGVRRLVRFQAMGHDLDVGQVIAVVAVEHRAHVHGLGEVRRAPAVGCHDHADAADAPVVVEADFVGEVVWMPLAGDDHVGIAIEPQFHRLAGLRRAERRDARDERGLRLLAAESAAHAAAGDNDVLGGEIEAMRDQLLHFGDVLRRADDVHRAIFAGHREADLPFEVEMLLTADGEAAREAVRRAADARGGLASCERAGGHDERLALERRRDIEDRLELLVLDAGKAHGLARPLDRRRDHGEDRLARVLDDVGGEDRIVVHHRAVVVLSGDVRGRQYRDDTRGRPHRGEIDVAQASMCLVADADRRMQRAFRQRDVVGIERFAGHVQMGALVDLSSHGSTRSFPAGRMRPHGSASAGSSRRDCDSQPKHACR